MGDLSQLGLTPTKRRPLVARLCEKSPSKDIIGLKDIIGPKDIIGLSVIASAKCHCERSEAICKLLF